VVGVWEVLGSSWPRPQGVAVRLALSALFLGLLLRSMVRFQWGGLEALLWCSGLAVLFLLLWASLGRLHETTAPTALLVSWLLTLLGTAAALALSYSASLGQLAGVLAAAVGGAWVATKGRETGAPGGALPVLLVVHGGLLLSGIFYADLDRLRGLTLAVLPLVGIVANVRPGRSELRNALRVAVVVVAVLVAVLAPLALEAARETDDYYDY